MPQFETRRPVPQSPDQMFALVADVEKYPEFLPLCDGLVVRSRKERDGKALLVADMTVGYRAIRETFTTQVLLNPAGRAIDVKYLDGPFKYLDNRWRFNELPDGGSEVHFFIDYEFKAVSSAPSWAPCSTAPSACLPKPSRNGPGRFTPRPPDGRVNERECR